MLRLSPSRDTKQREPPAPPRNTTPYGAFKATVAVACPGFTVTL
jgi:hypothetical protein